MAWEEYLGEGTHQIKPITNEMIDCIPLIVEGVEYQPQDYVCDEEYVWQCRHVPAKRWCNVHEPKSPLGYLAW